MIHLYMARDSMEARLIVARLQEEGIGADVTGEYLESTIPYVSKPSVRIADARDMQRAREIVREMSGPGDPAEDETEYDPSSHGSRSLPPGELSEGDLALLDADTGEPLGAITESDAELMEEVLESITPTLPRYYVDRLILEHLGAEGADARVIRALEFGLADREEMNVTWATFGE